MKAKKILLAILLFVGLKLVAQPNSQAPTPMQSSTDVISVFSDAYTNVSGTNFNPNWGQGTQVFDTVVSGDNIKKYHRLDYQGTQLGSRVNASSMENLHFDIWTPNGTQIQIFMVNEGNTGGPTEQSVTLSLTQNGWNSIDIPMSSYHSTIRSSISQFKIQVPGFVYQNSPFIYYLDNIYFWKSANIPTLSGFSFPTKFTNDAPFQITPPTSNSNGAFTYTSSNSSVATISGDMITIVGAGTSTITANQAADGAFSAASTSATLTVTFAPPSTAPASPTQMASNVISIFSNEYTPISGINFNPNWGQSTAVLDMNVASNDIKRYSNLNYQGTEFASALDVSTMDSLHFDIWTPNLNSFEFYLISFSPNIEQKVTVTPTKNGWNSYDIPLSTFPGVNKTALRQFKFVGAPSGSTVYLDNIYFYRAAGAPTITGFSFPTKYLGDAPFTITPPTSNSAGAFTYTSSNTNVATISGNIITIVGIGTTTITVNQAADGGFNAGSSTTPLNVRYAPPATAAPAPTHDSSIVLSLFSNAYTDVSGTNWNPNWGQSTIVSDISVSGDATKRYDNLNYQGVQFASAIDASAYNHLHLDLFTPNCTSFRVFLINPGGVERQVTLTPTLNGWNSYDIALSSFAGINPSNIIQFKFEGTPFGTSTVFYDNLYFWNAVVPTLGSFTVPAKELGDAPFNLTAPTSNSNGAFSFSSSNTSVATVSGSTVTIVGVGSTTITATQAADGSFGSVSVSATLNVTLPVLPQAPSTAAPTPNKPAFNVISLYSNAYTNRTVNTWSAVWDQADILDTVVAGNDTKKYSNLNFSGVEFTSNTINATNAEYFHIDIWTPNTNVFKVKLVDFGANGSYGGGDDVEHELTFTAPTLSSWTSYDIPMSAFTGLTTKAHLAQMIVVSNNSTVYFDNVYFWSNTCLNPVSDPSVSISESANNVCSGTSVTFTATPNNGGTNPNYNFKVNGVSVQNGSMTMYNTASLSNTDVVTCTITRTDGCADDGNSNAVIMTVKTLPTAASITSDFNSNTTTVSLCSIGKTISLYPSIGGGTWSNSNSTTVQLSASLNSGSSTRTITALASGTSTVSYTILSSNGCTNSTSVAIKVSPLAAPVAIIGATSVCVGSTNTYTNATVGGVWSGTRFSVSNLGSATAISAGTGLIKYTVTNADGCTNSSSLNVTINALPKVPTISFATGTTGVAGSGGYCKNKTFTLVGNPANGVWSKTGVVTINPAGTNSTTTIVNTGNVLGAASVTYTITNANNCSNQKSISTNIVSCGAKGILSNSINNEFTIYPNPAKNFVNINSNNIGANSKILISDLSGKVVLQQSLSLGLNKIDISKLSKGMYILTTINNNENKTQKLIIE